MKKFKVTVNGKSYEVDVEELGTAAPAAPVTPAPAPVAAASPAPTPAPAYTSSPVIIGSFRRSNHCLSQPR